MTVKNIDELINEIKQGNINKNHVLNYIESQIKQLESKIEKMKRCNNCKNVKTYIDESNGIICKLDNSFMYENEKCNNWELEQ